MAAAPIIRLLINTDTGYGRSLIGGVSRYAREHGPWIIALPPLMLPATEPNIPKESDGVIARVMDRALLKELERANLPVVNVSDAVNATSLLTVYSDHAKIGLMAADYLLGKGFIHFGFCGFDRYPFSQQRGTAFRQAIEASGRTCDVYDDQNRNRRDFGDALDRLGGWIASLPKPAAVLACNDLRGQHVIKACIGHGIRVPDEVAVLGVDNDTIICETTHVRLSSVNSGAEIVGYRAAEALHRMLKGENVETGPVPVPPVGIIQRLSTDVLVVDDPIVREAVRIMRRPGTPPSSIDEVLAELPISRRPFEVRFRNALSKTPYQELMTHRIDRARELLRTTDLSVEQIAMRCGFQLGTRLAAAFRKQTGESPSAYRRRTLEISSPTQPRE